MRLASARQAQHRREREQRTAMQPPQQTPPAAACADEPAAAPSAASRRRQRAQNARRVEAATDRFDQVATRALYIGLGPLVGGWALYALVHYPHTSWYSWLVSSLADAVYLFGFIGMTPQLFINYKLKSVAHMPWRVMTYKAFNTFVDDAFAILVAMPMHHKIACLRDDAVFIVFLVQRWLYPVDKTRANEYGIAYEREEEEEEREGAADGASGGEGEPRALRAPQAEADAEPSDDGGHAKDKEL